MAAASSGVGGNIAPAWMAEVQFGSLVSAISLSEIRYEGFLIEMTTNPYTIGLRNVRFLGTEGRKKYGPQVPPSDKIYEYIYLRGSNIKDLRVIPSRSTQSKLLVPEDPAIIRPRVAHPTSTTMASTSHGAAQGANVSISAQPILPGTSFQFNQSRDPSASSSSIRRSLPPPPPANNSRLAVPNYLPGLAGSSGRMSHVQQKLPLPPPSLVASQAPVQQQVQRQNVNTSVVGGSSFYKRHPPLLLRRSTTSSNAVPPLVSTPSVQSNPGQPSPSQSLQIMDTDAKTALAPVTESLPSDTTEETPGSMLKLTTETGSAPSHHEKGQSSQEREQVNEKGQSSQGREQFTQVNEKGQSSQGREQVNEKGQSSQGREQVNEKGQSSQGREQVNEKCQFSQGREQVNRGPREDTGRSLGRKNVKPRVKRGFKEDFNFEAMNQKFNKKEVWDYFDNIEGEARRGKDNSKPVYCKEKFFDYLSYGAPNNELAKVTISQKKDKETFGAEIPIIQEHRGPRKQEWRPRLK